jgi:hypothetical protein
MVRSIGLKNMPKVLDGVGTYEPTFSFVHVPMIAVAFSIILLLWYFVLNQHPILGTFQGSPVVEGGAPGTPQQNYLSYAGWYQGQYSADGAEAGYKTHGVDVYLPN